MNTKKINIINGFVLKILGMFFMTLDHVGVFLAKYENLYQISTIFRCLGRISLPIFIFLIVEGVKYTRDFGKYIFRLEILAFIFLIGQMVVKYILKIEVNDFTSPFLDLITVASFCYFIKKEDRQKFYALIPAVYSLICFIAVNTELRNGTSSFWLPIFIRSSYPLFSLLLGISFLYADKLTIMFLKSNVATENLDETEYVRYGSNIISGLSILVITFIFYILYKYQIVTYWNNPTQIYACLAMLPIFFYSGTRGYNKKWFKYGSYLYFPVHLIIIYLIFALI